MPGRLRPFEPTALALIGDPADEGDDYGPASRVRRVESNERVRSLVVFTGLLGADAEGAWVTVSDVHGVLYFEGSPAADGSVAVYVDDSRRVDTLHVLLETARMHRQAEVALSDGVNEYVFRPAR